MKTLFLALFGIVSILSVSAQLNGTYIGDWQNNCFQQCAPQSINITAVNKTNSNISYVFTPANLALCQNPTGLTLNSTNSTLQLTVGNLWTDGFGFTLVVNSFGLSYNFGGAGQPIFLYNNGTAYFNQTDSLGSIGGSWMNPVPLTGVNASACCIPDSIFLEINSPQSQLGALYTYASSSNCAGVNTTNYQYSLTAPSNTALNWTGIPSNNTFTNNNISFVPSANLTNFTLALNSSCSFYFQKAAPAKTLSQTWMRDWQSANAPSVNTPQTYQISTVNKAGSTYMISTTTRINGSTFNGFVVETPQGTYYDSINTTYTYDPTTQTLLDTPDKQLLSPNGSVLTSGSFTGNWTSPIELTHNSLPSGCCTPTSIMISNNNTGSKQTPLEIVYQLPSNYLNIENCQDLIGIDVNTSQLIGLMTVPTPSISSLTWTDTFGSNIALINSSRLAIYGFSGNCNMSVSLYVPPTPPPPPGPLSASLVSTGIVSLVAGLFAIFAF